MKSNHIHIKGRVQGVGMRPFIYKKAYELGIDCMIANQSDGVHVWMSGERKYAEQFLKLLLKSPPEFSVITGYNIIEDSIPFFTGVRIIESKSVKHSDLFISPDFAICDQCKEDIHNSTNRRYNYAFTTCTNCGPRYSIMNKLPYDRVNTEMEAFKQCDNCQKEYQDIQDRRYYSQTNSCDDCGIKMSIYQSQKQIKGLDQDQIIIKIAEEIIKGRIVAIKGIGGFLLMCDARNSESIKTLRSKKKRPEKPFAVMFPDIKSIRRGHYLTDYEEEELTSYRAPIVLLQRKDKTNIDVENIAPGLDTIGALIPYTPLFQLILNRLKFQVVATSGNISGAPIIYDNNIAIQHLSDIADFVVINDRHIVAPQDDSVIRFCEGHRTILRRSRGFAPAYFGSKPAELENDILALGAEMKASFSITHSGLIHTSQYLGNLSGFESQQEFIDTIQHLKCLLNAKIEKVLTDSHPGYFVNSYAKELTEQFGLPIEEIQHHKAHFAAVIQENDLWSINKKVLGVIWDGTGYGEDRNIWGGEFFEYGQGEMGRLIHLRYAPVIANDKMSVEPRLSAFAYTNGADYLRHKFSETECGVYQQLLKSCKTKTSSMGRLFDAVASILGIIDISSYEGQAASLLESLARKSTKNISKGYNFSIFEKEIEYGTILNACSFEFNHEVPVEDIALRFHVTLVEMIEAVATKNEMHNIAFSGGVFQNTLLTELIKNKLGSDYNLFFHKELSPNDENISFGQLAYYQKVIVPEKEIDIAIKSINEITVS